MDASDNVGSEFEDRERLRYVNLFRSDLTADLAEIAYVRPEGFRRLVKAISLNDQSLENTILRRWGVWR